jgi:vancomycin permeability regulator SanA
MLDRFIAWLLSTVITQLNRMEDLIMAIQDDVNARAAAIEAAVAAEKQQVSDHLAELAAEIQALKDQIATGTTPDFTALDVKIATIQTIYEP